MVDENLNRKNTQKSRSNLKTKENIKKQDANVKVNQSRKQSKNQKNKKNQPSNKKAKKKQADDKSASIKKAKAIRKLFNWTILIGIIVGILVFLCKSETFKICNIEIAGNNQVSQEKILLLSGIDLEDNIFLSNTIKAKEKISENPYIKEVKIKRVLPDKIKIEVVEKQKEYMLQVDGKFAYIDKNGDILEISETKLENLIILQGYLTQRGKIAPGNTLNEEDIDRLEDIQKILKSGEKNGINDKIYSINIKDKNNYILSLPDYKKIVYIGDTSNLATKMLRTKDIIDKTMEKEGKIFVNGNFNEGFDPYFREEANN